MIPGVGEEHCGAPDCRDRVRNPLSGNIRSAAVNRFEQRIPIADVCTREKTETAYEVRGNV